MTSILEDEYLTLALLNKLKAHVFHEEYIRPLSPEIIIP